MNQDGFVISKGIQTPQAHTAIATNSRGVHVPTKEEILQKYNDIAEGMETQFNEYMLAQMNKSIDKDEPESSATQYYNSLLDSERAQILSKNNGGLGLKKMILEQILPAHLKPQPSSTMIRAYAEQAKFADQGLTATKENSHE